MSRGNFKPGAYTIYNRVELIRGGKEYFDKLEAMLDDASELVHLQTYIYDYNETGKRIGDALKRAAKRNVRVYLLVDAYASQKLPRNFIDELTNAGVHFNFFKPFFKGRNFYLGRRLHHKAVVVDGFKCMVAGLNISNRYNDILGMPAWFDWAVYAEGEVSMQVNEYCTALWNKHYRNDRCKQLLRSRNGVYDECYVRMRINDWVNGRTEITQSYFHMFRHARSEVIIMTSYFWPARKFLRKIAAALKRGVKIKLVLASKSDIRMAKFAERYMYNWLFRNGVEVYEYQDNILHGKMAICDSNWVTVGSYNINNISAYASLEMNLEIKDVTFALHAKQKLESIIEKSCVRITHESYEKKYNIFQKALYAISYEVIHILFILFTFYFKQPGARRGN
jgi:cardiolipin synthase